MAGRRSLRERQGGESRQAAEAAPGPAPRRPRNRGHGIAGLHQLPVGRAAARPRTGQALSEQAPAKAAGPSAAPWRHWARESRKSDNLALRLRRLRVSFYFK